MSNINDTLFEMVRSEGWQAINDHADSLQQNGNLSPESSETKTNFEDPFLFDLDPNSDFLGEMCNGLLADFPDFEFEDDVSSSRNQDCFEPPSKRLKTGSDIDFETVFSYSPPFNIDTPISSGGVSCAQSLSPSSEGITLPMSGQKDSSENSSESDEDVTCAFTSHEHKSAEYHFDQIRVHCELAIKALQTGRYEKSKHILTLAHDIKNKSANEVKKAAEKAWECDKDKEEGSFAYRAPVRRPMIGSTKRVEQFRKNLRRWMIGTHVHQIGVEWMVYARMEHLQKIASFILGDNLPEDPASSNAVTESVCKHLDVALPTSFVEQELAEPEPGKRYAIGQTLATYLNSIQPRKVPTLAFTMPSESDPVALQAWISDLKSLFPQKPAPKIKAPQTSSPPLVQCLI